MAQQDLDIQKFCTCLAAVFGHEHQVFDRVWLEKEQRSSWELSRSSGTIEVSGVESEVQIWRLQPDDWSKYYYVATFSKQPTRPIACALTRHTKWPLQWYGIIPDEVKNVFGSASA